MTPPAIYIRTAEPVDVDQLARLRAALWPDESPAQLRAEAARFLAQPRRGPGAMPEVVFVAEDWARQLGCTEFASDALAENAGSAAAHRALGFEEVEIIRCFRKELALAP